MFEGRPEMIIERFFREVVRPSLGQPIRSAVSTERSIPCPVPYSGDWRAGGSGKSEAPSGI